MTLSKNNSKRNARSCSGITKASASMGREIMLTCRVSSEMMKILNEASKQTGITRSDYIRSFLAAGLKKISGQTL